MKKQIILFFVFVLATTHVYAQQISVAEPEFNNSYCILTSDSTFEMLPKENGTVQEHQNKVSKWSKIIGGVADVAGAAGNVLLGTSGSVNGMVTGIQTMEAASSVSQAADVVNGLSSSNGMDIVFKGGHSSHVAQKTNDGIRILVKADNNEYDPTELFRIVRFSGNKKERRIQWFNFQPAFLGNEETEKQGYVAFSGHKYGERSYILTIPKSELESGEYGIFYMSVATATEVPVGTFGIK